MLHSPLQPMWDFTILPLGGPVSSLAHRPVSGSDNICKLKLTARRYCPLWPIMYRREPQGFKTRLLGKGFHTLIKRCFFLLSNQCGDLTILPRGPSILAGTDTICNSLSPPLVDIVCFSPLRSTVNLMVLKRIYYGEVSTPL